MDFSPLIVCNAHTLICIHSITVALKGPNTKVKFATCNLSPAFWIAFPGLNYLIPSNENTSHSQSWSEHANMEPSPSLSAPKSPSSFWGGTIISSQCQAGISGHSVEMNNNACQNRTKENTRLHDFGFCPCFPPPLLFRLPAFIYTQAHLEPKSKKWGGGLLKSSGSQSGG